MQLGVTTCPANFHPGLGSKWKAMNSKSQFNVCNLLPPNNRQPRDTLLPPQDWHPNEQKSLEIRWGTQITLCGLGFYSRERQLHVIPQTLIESMLYTGQCRRSAARDSTTSPAFHPLKTLLGDSGKRAATVTSSQCLTAKLYRETKCKVKNAKTMLTTKLGDKVAPQTPQIQDNGRNHQQPQDVSIFAPVLEKAKGGHRASDELDIHQVFTGKHRWPILRQWLKLGAVLLTLKVGACKTWVRRSEVKRLELHGPYELSMNSSRTPLQGVESKLDTDITKIKERWTWNKSRGGEEKQEISEKKLPYIFFNMMWNNRRGS